MPPVENRWFRVKRDHSNWEAWRELLTAEVAFESSLMAGQDRQEPPPGIGRRANRGDDTRSVSTGAKGCVSVQYGTPATAGTV